MFLTRGLGWVQKIIKIPRYSRSGEHVTEKSLGIGIQNSSCHWHQNLNQMNIENRICTRDLMLSWRNPVRFFFNRTTYVPLITAFEKA